MVLYLLKRDDTFKGALVVSLFAPTVLLAGPGLIISGSLLGAAAFLVLVMAARFRLDQRTSHFEAALPIAGRQIYLARVAGALAMVWLPVAVACLALLLVRGSAGKPLAGLLVQGGAVLTLAALCPLSVRLQEAAIPGPVAAGICAAVAAAGVAIGFLVPPLVHLLLFFTAGTVVFLRAYRTVPPSFQTSPLEAIQERQPWLSHGARRWGGRRRPVWWPIWRSAFPWLVLILLPCGVFAGSGIQIAPMFLVIVFQTGVLARNGTRWLESLPLSHRARLALTLATTVVPFLIGASIGIGVQSGPFHNRTSVGSVGPHGGSEQFRYAHTNVPLQYWRWAPGGRVPVIRAPWGETVQPAPVSILGLTFYNPYAAAYNPWRPSAVTNANSERFFEWQYENATQAVYGRRITFTEYIDTEKRIVTHDVPDLNRNVLQDAMGIERDFDALDRVLRRTVPGKTRLDILTLAALLFALLFCVFLRELALWHALKRTTLLARRLFGLAPVSIFAYLGLDLFFQFRNGTPVVAPLCQALLMRASAWLPQDLLLLTAIAVLPALAMYWILERQFGQSEMTGPLLPSLQSVGRGMEPK